MHNYPVKILSFNDGVELEPVVLETKEQFTAFVESFVKLPGSYDLKNTKDWQKVYRKYEETGKYTDTVKNTLAWNKFWDVEKQKIMNGVIINGFYLPPFYYFYLNFNEIQIKERRDVTAPYVYDSDYHFFLYIMLCILKGKHAVVVKTRQRGYSYKIMAILIWSYWWFKGSANTLGASDKAFVEKTWLIAEGYRNHLNTKTAWKRGPHIPKTMEWIERNLAQDGSWVGNMAVMRGITFQQSPTKGVGGYQSFFFYEEAGVAPTLGETIKYIKPAVTAGNETTGTIIVSGSVGDLDDCKDLKDLFYKPEGQSFLAVDNIWEKNPEYKRVGFFVPETWNLKGFMDEDGNSQIEKAEAFVLAKRRELKEASKEEAYRLEVSQAPLTPREAFDWRKTSYFPTHIISRQLERLDTDEERSKRPKRVELFEDSKGSISFKYLEDNEGHPVITKLTKDISSAEDKRGCVVIKELPAPGSTFLDYFAGVDPIMTDVTTTSESLFSITIFKNLVEVRYTDTDGEVKTRLEGYREVAWYVGRMEDLPETNKIGEYLLRFYNARAAVESNVQTFINHMQSKGLQRLMFQKNELKFLEDIGANEHVHKQYGVHMTPLTKSYIFANIKEYISEVLDVVRKTNSEEIVMKIYGVSRICNVGVLNEAKEYVEGLNVDRLISFGLALTAAKMFAQAGIHARRSEVKDEKPKVIAKPTKSFFRQISNIGDQAPARKSFFKYMK